MNSYIYCYIRVMNYVKMNSQWVENSFYIVNFQFLKCYNFRPDDNIRLSREAIVPNEKRSCLNSKSSSIVLYYEKSFSNSKAQVLIFYNSSIFMLLGYIFINRFYIYYLSSLYSKYLINNRLSYYHDKYRYSWFYLEMIHIVCVNVLVLSGRKLTIR